jgi:hypothetical protein
MTVSFSVDPSEIRKILRSKGIDNDIRNSNLLMARLEERARAAVAAELIAFESQDNVFALMDDAPLIVYPTHFYSAYKSDDLSAKINKMRDSIVDLEAQLKTISLVSNDALTLRRQSGVLQANIKNMEIVLRRRKAKKG